MLEKITKSLLQLPLQLKKLVVRQQFILLAAAALGIILLCIFTPLKTVFNPFLFKDFIQQYEGYVEILFIAIYTGLTVIGIPGTVLTIVGGLSVWHLVWHDYFCNQCYLWGIVCLLDGSLFVSRSGSTQAESK